MRAPFPYFGGKSSVAADVWQRLGTPKQSRGKHTYAGSSTTDKECVWYSPACLPLTGQCGLFAEIA